MLKKIAFALLLAAFVVSQMTFFAARQNAAATENAEMIELATKLPDADVVMALDIDRALNVAAPNLLNDDPKKIEHLKNLLKTVENQIGLNPGVVKQIAAGVKLPPSGTKDILENTEFTAIVRTNVSNANLLDEWSRKMQLIFAFNEEKAPTARYIAEFRRFRDFKMETATPEKIKSGVQNLEDALAKTKKIAAAVDALPKISVAPKAVSDFKAENKSLADTINKHLIILKADTDAQGLRTATIKLLNRWNDLAVDDPERSAKLASINKEAQAVYPAYRKKIENAQKIENLLTEPDAEDTTTLKFADNNGDAVEPTGFASTMSSQLDTILQSLGKLPTVKLKRTAELNSLTDSYKILTNAWDLRLATMQAAVEDNGFADITKPENQITPTPAFKDFSAQMKQAQTEQTIGGKQMILIDIAKLDKPSADDSPKEETGTPENKQTPAPKLAVGFLDDKTLAIGIDKNVESVLTHDADYKNQKAAEMLSTDKNAVAAFAANSSAVRRIMSELNKAGTSTEAVGSGSSAMEKFIGDINIYGSVAYEGEGKTTNDVTMSMGFFKDNSAENSASKPTVAPKSADTDNTYDIAGYQVAKDIFNDLFNSFTAMRASVSFKFEKKKIASLVKSVPQMLDRMSAKNPPPTKSLNSKPRRLDTIQDVIAAPQIYLDLIKLFGDKIG